MYDVGHNFVDGVGQLAVRRQQEVPQWFIDQLREIKSNSASKRKDWQLACSIPVVVHEEWLKEGYDCTQEPAAKTIARLKALHLDHFIATTKRV